MKKTFFPPGSNRGKAFNGESFVFGSMMIAQKEKWPDRAICGTHDDLGRLE